MKAAWMPSRRRPPRTTAAVLLLGATALVSSALLLVLSPSALIDPARVAAGFSIGAFELALAAMTARLAPGNATAPLLAAMGLIVLLTESVDVAGFSPALEGLWMLLYLPLGLILLVAPTGRAASRRRRATGIALCAVVVAFALLCAAQAIWPPASDALGVPGVMLLLAFLGLLVLCAAAPYARFRRADEDGRLRLRWVLAAGLSLPLALLLCWASYLVLGTPDLVVLGLLVTLLAIPAGAAVAATRPNLFDVDRATVAGVAGAALLAAGLALLTMLGLVAGRPLSEWGALPAAVASGAVTLAGVCAYPFAVRGFERILFPDRGRAIRGLRQLSKRVDAGAAPPEEVQDVLRDALRDPGLAIAYRRLGDGALIGLDGAELCRESIAASDATAAVRVRGEEIGAIVPAAGRGRRPAAAIARAAAPLIDAVRSRSELARAAAEAEASRERLLRAGYEERRRLERDLHDGTQQRLVALGMQLRVLQRTAAADPQVAESLDAAVAQLGTAVAELRRIAQGVRPSALDDGLGPALVELGRLAPDVIELDVAAGELPDAVALTAFFVVSEGVANALRHAGASRILVLVRRTDVHLRVRVSDDGRGGAAPLATGGLTGLDDRVRALGGRLRLDSREGVGTMLEAVLPCAS